MAELTFYCLICQSVYLFLYISTLLIFQLMRPFSLSRDCWKFCGTLRIPLKDTNIHAMQLLVCHKYQKYTQRIEVHFWDCWRKIGCHYMLGCLQWHMTLQTQCWVNIWNKGSYSKCYGTFKNVTLSKNKNVSETCLTMLQRHISNIRHTSGVRYSMLLLAGNGIWRQQ